MKKKLTLFLITASLLFSSNIVLAEKKATVINLDTGHRKEVTVGDPHAFAGGYSLEVAYGYKKIPEPKEGELGFSVVSGYKTTLSSSMTSTQTTIPASSMVSKDGTTLTMSLIGTKVFLTVEPGGNKEEIIMCTGISASTWTGCTRGLGFTGTSTAAVAANRKTHNSGSILIMSNVHYVYDELVDKDTADTIGGDKTFTGNVLFYLKNLYNNLTINATDDEDTLVDKEYVDSVVQQGGATSTESVTGITQLGTALETASSTFDSQVPTVLQTKNATSSPAYGCDGTATAGALCVPVAQNNGKLSDSFTDFTTTKTFTGEVNLTASSSIASTSVDKLLVIDGRTQTWATASSSLTSKGYVDYMSDNTIFIGVGESDGTLTSTGGHPYIAVADGATTNIALDFEVPAGRTSISSIGVIYTRDNTGNLVLGFGTSSFYPIIGNAKLNDSQANTTYAGGASDGTIGVV